ncbi:MAG: 1-acyl-sn-glycerol-3-phosphate acyltransferase [Proteobacteria bacterium]|nr:MAG: 1-acyl-sn-glycerol-3-phosphate acyltransferase [Pseudomonadota bacterium]
MTLWLGLRSVVFTFFFFLVTGVMGIISPFISPFLSPDAMYRFLQKWGTINLFLLKVICGVKWQLRGEENIHPESTAIVLSNHQSTWETMYLLSLFPSMSWVIKQELINLPVFGWGMRKSRPIAIDRKAGRSALCQIQENGKIRLDQGNWVCIFPEGTRVLPGKKARFKLGGAQLAVHSGYPICPVAHNAGECWPRGELLKVPGTITVSIGPRIEVAGKTPEQVNKEVEEWITEERKRLPLVR